ncbi:hypothetical protein SADUNF_Sadunf09G0020600 [Salix dunnii]|uniref:Uncharacterized protein n=1 Tax=Salix dunnii TaxID=1413687 RepID=A0A835JSL6_9ROSI|nr:hypothetical protein SADUNF_Sadunf09G0020600 [Salix dunnii]
MLHSRTEKFRSFWTIVVVKNISLRFLSTCKSQGNLGEEEKNIGASGLFSSILTSVRSDQMAPNGATAKPPPLRNFMFSQRSTKMSGGTTFTGGELGSPKILKNIFSPRICSTLEVVLLCTSVLQVHYFYHRNG